MSEDQQTRPEPDPVDAPAGTPAADPPAPLGPPPVQLVIEESPRPRITLSVGLYGDVDADRQWVEYGWAQLQGFLRRHAGFARQLADVAEADAAVVAARVKAAERPPQAPQPSQPPRGGAARPANGGSRAGGPRGARGGNRGGGGGRGSSRRDRFPLAEGWVCDQCGGACGIQAARGNMPSDKVVCLGECTEGDGYVYTVGWLDD